MLAATMPSYACLPSQLPTLGPYAITGLDPSHIEPIRQWRNAQMDVLRQREPISVEQQQRYYDTHIWPTLASPQPPQLLLSFSHAGRAIGYGGLVHIAWAHRRAEVSFLVDPARAADLDGYAADFGAFLLLLRQLAFGPLGFQRLWTETYATRAHHIGVLEAHGFEPEGRLRRHVILDGLPVDSLVHGCLA